MSSTHKAKQLTLLSLAQFGKNDPVHQTRAHLQHQLIKASTSYPQTFATNSINLTKNTNHDTRAMASESPLLRDCVTTSTITSHLATQSSRPNRSQTLNRAR